MSTHEEEVSSSFDQEVPRVGLLQDQWVSAASRAEDPPDVPSNDARSQAERFIAVLTGDANTPVTFQTFADNEGGKGTRSQVWHGTLADHWEVLTALNQIGQGVFLMVNAGDLRGRKAENVTQLRAVFIDDDDNVLLDASGRPGAAFSPLPPSIVVQTPHGCHAYFLLHPDEPRERFTAAQAHLASHFGSDPKVKDLPRVMRVPGFLHRKDPLQPVMVRLVDADAGRRYAIDDVLVAYPARENRRAASPAAPQKVLSERTAEARDFLATQPPAVEGQGGDQLTFQTCCALIRGFDLPERDALDLLMQEWVPRCRPPWSRDEMQQKLVNAREYGTEDFGGRLVDGAAETVFKRFGTRALLEHCVPVLNHRFKLLRVADGTEHVFAVNDRSEATLLLDEAPLEQAVYEALKAKFGSIPPEAVLKKATQLWRRECVPLAEEPAPFCFRGDDRLCFKRFDWMPTLGEYPAWNEFLSRLSDAPAFMAFCWSCFERENRSRQYVWLRGDGQDGKSQVLSAIKNIFGSSAAGIANAQLQGGKQFLYSALYGKRVVIYGDCKNTKFGMTEFVRNCTSGDPVSVEFKNQTPFMHCFRLKLFVASNPKPEFSGQIADMSRAIYIEVEPSLTKDDPTWAARLEEEMPHFLWACQQAYRDMCPKGGDIALGARSLELKEEASIAFEERWADIFEANFRKLDGASTPARLVRDRLRSCGLTNQDIPDFKQWMERTYKVKYVARNNGRFYTGLEVIQPLSSILG